MNRTRTGLRLYRFVHDGTVGSLASVIFTESGSHVFLIFESFSTLLSCKRTYPRLGLIQYRLSFALSLKLSTMATRRANASANGSADGTMKGITNGSADSSITPKSTTPWLKEAFLQSTPVREPTASTRVIRMLLLATYICSCCFV